MDEAVRSLGALLHKLRRRLVMVEVIEVYVPKNLRRPLKRAPARYGGQIIELCSQNHKPK